MLSHEFVLHVGERAIDLLGGAHATAAGALVIEIPGAWRPMRWRERLELGVPAAEAWVEDIRDALRVFPRAEL